MFVDRVQIEIQGGRGGNGCVSFRREKYVPHGGPDGGDGGDGGSVIILAQNGGNNLSALAHHKHWKAESGNSGSGYMRDGQGAKGMTMLVPPGTIIYDVKWGLDLKDLAQDGDNVIA